MSVTRAVFISAKIAALAGAVFIAIAAQTVGMSVSVADEGGTNQTTPPPSPDGNSWGG